MGNAGAKSAAHPQKAAVAGSSPLKQQLDSHAFDAYAQHLAQRNVKHMLGLQQLPVRLPVKFPELYGQRGLCVPARDAGGRMAVAKCALTAQLVMRLLQEWRVMGVNFLSSQAAVLHLSRSIMQRCHVRRSVLGAVAAEGPGCVAAFGKEGKGSGEFDSPMSVAFDGLGNVAVGCRHRVQIFRYSDWAPVLSLKAAFKNACAIAYDGSGHIVVVDFDNHRVQVFRSSDGQHVMNIGGEGGSSKQLHFPSGVCCDGRGNIVVHDGYSNGRLQVYRLSDGAHVRTIGKRGSGAGQFEGAGHLTFDAEGNLAVSDIGRIHVLEYSSGKSLRSIRSPAWAIGSNIALDSGGHIVIADESSNNVQVVGCADGDHVRTVGTGSWGSGLGEFNRPCGIAIDGDGRMLVCDMNNDRMQVLQ